MSTLADRVAAELPCLGPLYCEHEPVENERCQRCVDRPAVLALLEAVIEEAAMLHESVDTACDHERTHGDPGAGAMAAVIQFRDLIRRIGEP